MIKNLGKAVSILARQEAASHFAFEDLAAFHAPSECYPIVERGERRRARLARRHAEAVAGAPLRVIAKEARKRGSMTIFSGDPKWERAVGKAYTELVGG